MHAGRPASVVGVVEVRHDGSIENIGSGSRHDGERQG